MRPDTPLAAIHRKMGRPAPAPFVAPSAGDLCARIDAVLRARR